MTPQTEDKADSIYHSLNNFDFCHVHDLKALSDLLAYLTNAKKEEREAGKAYVRNLARGNWDKPFAVD